MSTFRPGWTILALALFAPALSAQDAGRVAFDSASPGLGRGPVPRGPLPTRATPHRAE